ncbi:hypothetical protein [Bacillus sp. V59.32b]|uniref:hypothetical protein n=1 Tax=Bacillus sp. V59.32b TaxID=1758642 RepID=UPI000E3E9236|nr:hypothetical protein [Bacillus sp. V59.32b]RFU69312.1 hypothetical protein D0463_02785 [Bacillus sp. V59.32b]
MRGKIAVLIVLICSILIGCTSKETISRHNYKFYGESKHWTATLHFVGIGVNSNHYDEDKKDFVLEYKGSYTDISKSIVKYSIKSSGFSEGGSESPPGTKYIRHSDEGTGGAIQKKDDVIKVLVEWNGEKEVVPMKVTNH